MRYRGMKEVATWMVTGALMLGMAWGEPEAEGPQVFPGQEDAMLRKLMGEMLKEAEAERREMEKPVELPELDAPDLQRLLGEAKGPAAGEKRWIIGVRLLPGNGGRVLVEGVLPGTPAAVAGLKGGDVLRSVNGIRLRDQEMLMDLLQVVQDQEVVLGVARAGEEMQIKMTPREENVGPRSAPDMVPANGAVLEELRGMRSLMEQMLKEMKRENARVPPRPRTRSVPRPPQK